MIRPNATRARAHAGVELRPYTVANRTLVGCVSAHRTVLDSSQGAGRSGSNGRNRNVEATSRSCVDFREILPGLPIISTVLKIDVQGLSAAAARRCRSDLENENRAGTNPDLNP